MLLYKNCANGLSENAKYNVVFSYFTRLYVAHSFLDLDSAFKCYNVMLLVMNYWLHNPAAPLTKFQMLPIDGVHTPIGGVLQVYTSFVGICLLFFTVDSLSLIFLN